MTFYEKYLELCSKIGKTPSGAALEIGLSKPTVNRWKNGGGITDATAYKVASYFGISPDELTSETDVPSPAPSAAAPEQKEKAPQSAAERLTEGLDEESLKKLLEYAEFLKSRQEKKENQ